MVRFLFLIKIQSSSTRRQLVCKPRGGQCNIVLVVRLLYRTFALESARREKFCKCDYKVYTKRARRRRHRRCMGKLLPHTIYIYIYMYYLYFIHTLHVLLRSSNFKIVTLKGLNNCERVEHGTRTCFEVSHFA